VPNIFGSNFQLIAGYTTKEEKEICKMVKITDKYLKPWYNIKTCKMVKMTDKYLKPCHNILCYYAFVLFLAVRHSSAQPAG